MVQLNLIKSVVLPVRIHILLIFKTQETVQRIIICRLLLAFIYSVEPPNKPLSEKYLRTRIVQVQIPQANIRIPSIMF